MLITITNKTQPATDLGYLLHKNPQRCHQVELAFGTATVFYPVADYNLCTACLVVDVDPLTAVEGRGVLAHVDAPYVNDRPYVASSLLGSAIGRVFGTALSGRCKERPDLVDRELDLVVTLPSLNVNGRMHRLKRLFEPLGYEVSLDGQSDLDSKRGSGSSAVTLSGTKTVKDLLSHLSVIIPVIDGHIHQWVDAAYVDMVLERSKNWLSTHPEAAFIIWRAFKYQRGLAKKALEILPNRAPDNSPTLNDQRYDAVERALTELGSTRVIDLGCGVGNLLMQLGRNPQFRTLVGVDISRRALDLARERVAESPLANQLGQRIQFKQSSMLYRDPSLGGFDAALLIEVIEHIDEDRLPTLEHIVFGLGDYQTVIVTTPNREYNALLSEVGAQSMRHGDHRFEWSRAEFGAWVERIARDYGYEARVQGIGDYDEALGYESQMVVFTRLDPTPERQGNDGAS